jgi:hypothetical protein
MLMNHLFLPQNRLRAISCRIENSDIQSFSVDFLEKGWIMVERTEDKRGDGHERDDCSRAPWERPALRRLAANDAEMGGTISSDNPGDTNS